MEVYVSVSDRVASDGDATVQESGSGRSDHGARPRFSWEIAGHYNSIAFY
jgi:hypothetical protein